MKVYELMDILSNCSAGAEVRFSMLKTVEDLIKAKPQVDDGKVFYAIDTDIKEAVPEYGDKKEVLFLYA